LSEDIYFEDDYSNSFITNAPDLTGTWSAMTVDDNAELPTIQLLEEPSQTSPSNNDSVENTMVSNSLVSSSSNADSILPSTSDHHVINSDLTVTQFPSNSIPSETVCLPSSHDDAASETISPERRSARVAVRPSHLTDYITTSRTQRLNAMKSQQSTSDDSPTLLKALQSDDAPEWINALLNELRQLERRNTWSPVSTVPQSSKVLPCHFILKQKRDPNGNKTQKKARLVVGGNYQPSNTYDEISSPTSRMTSVKILMQLAAAHSYYVKSFDIAGAYLHAPIDKDIYIRVPAFGDNPSFIAKLNKSLYGLRQAGALWNKHLHDSLTAFGLSATLSDPCVYQYITEEYVIYVCLWVDDLYVVSSSTVLIDRLRSHLENIYGEIHETDGDSYIGISITRESADGSIVWKQPALLTRLFEICGLTGEKVCSVATPTALNYNGGPSTIDADNTPCDQQLFSSAVGTLLYLCHSRPDISYPVSILATKSHCPTKHDWKAVKRCARYLYGTRDLGLHFPAISEIKLNAYVDASYASHTDCHSHTGLYFSLCPNCPPIYAQSKKQNLVALSSTEAEIEAIKSASTFAIWLREFMIELGYEHQTIQIFEDNYSAISLMTTKDGGNWGRTRHFKVRYHFVKSQIEETIIDLIYVPTHEQVADGLTKPLAKAKYELFRNKILCFSLLS